MTKALMVLPFNNGSVQFPGVDQSAITSWVIGSYAPPPPGTAPYVLVWLEATDTAIATLTARSDCLFICNRLEDGSFDTPSINATTRNAVRTKISNMGFTGAQYGLLNAAIQASQNRAQLAYAIATKAFFRNVNKDLMTDADVAGTYQ